MKKNLKIAFFGSSIVSAYWNGAATYYRGIVKALHKMGHEVTFYEPDIYERQKHRDIEDPDWCKVVVYEKDQEVLEKHLDEASKADVIIKASGVGAFDDFLEEEIVDLKTEQNIVVFWDVDAPATLDRIENDVDDPFNKQIPKYDFILTYGGGQPVIDAYERNGAKKCVPIYNALDTETHFPVEADTKFFGTLAFLGNRLPDREARVEEFFIKPAQNLPKQKFLIGGSGWDNKEMPENIEYLGHVYTKDHNAFNCTPMAVLNISRDSMAKYGFSPATRVFEPGKEIFVAKSGKEVEKILAELTPEMAKEIGDAAYKKVLNAHTYEHRAELLEEVISSKMEQEPTPIELFLNTRK